MLKYRLLSALIGVPLLIYVSFIGGPIFIILISILAAISYFECKKAFNQNNEKNFNVDYFDILTYLYIFIGFLVINFFTLNIDVLIYTYLILAMGLTVIKKFSVNLLINNVFCFIYASIPFIVLIKIRYISLKYFYLAFIVAFMTDSFAYFVGRIMGKNKLCPSISPKKTVEGFIGGIIGCFICVYIYSYFWPSNSKLYIMTAVIGSVFSQIGDLSASLIKRNFKIKDFGNIIPGHGGVIDRFDSVFFVSVIVYLLIYIIK